jgi:N6-L-threonylcarbamoyladenine synthase
VAPPVSLCTDNGTMIAWAGLERFLHCPMGDDISSIRADPRWTLSMNMYEFSQYKTKEV